MQIVPPPPKGKEIQLSLNSSEKQIIDLYRRLNPSGREKTLIYIYDMLLLKKYTERGRNPPELCVIQGDKEN